MTEPIETMPADYRSGFVAIIGKPNVGKSTLLNAMVGEKVAIVSPKPQTTRRQIRGILTLPNAQIVFVDTPGIHQPLHKLGRALVRDARAAIPDADVIVFVSDVTEMPDEADRHIASLLRQARGPVLLVMNKEDALRPAHVIEHSDAYRALGPWADWMLVSAIRGDNLSKVLSMIIERLPLGPPMYPTDLVTDQTDRLIVSELVREQALRFLEQEVPHALEVVVEEWADRPNGMLYVEAHLLVEKESQKGIVIGAHAAMLKKIGQSARQQIEQMLERKVFLELRVKVREHWREDESELRRMGYGQAG
ncbi:MAG: GTPase Era [Chloroflexi bacterium]|nr:GTPase Era [Chloroflexota bacterium]